MYAITKVDRQSNEKKKEQMFKSSDDIKDKNLK